MALADALMRQARVTGDATLPRAGRAGPACPAHRRHRQLSRPRRMLGATYLAQHRFVEALGRGRRARGRFALTTRGTTASLATPSLELGLYDEAFGAFDRMAGLKPSAASYARVAYARELRGDSPGAAAMQMAVESQRAHGTPRGSRGRGRKSACFSSSLARCDEASPQLPTARCSRSRAIRTRLQRQGQGWRWRGRPRPARWRSTANSRADADSGVRRAHRRHPRRDGEIP